MPSSPAPPSASAARSRWISPPPDGTLSVHYHKSADEAASAVREIEALGRRAVAIKADLTRESEVAQIVPQATITLGPLSCLVNSASTFVMDDIRSVTRAGWDSHMETNLRAPLVLSQAFAAQLPDGQTGAIVNMLDERVWKLTPYFLSYTVAKCGLWTLTQTLALALAPRIRVNGIGPGPTLPSPRQTEAQFKAQWDSMPLKRGTTPAEICRAVRFHPGIPRPDRPDDRPGRGSASGLGRSQSGICSRGIESAAAGRRPAFKLPSRPDPRVTVVHIGRPSNFLAGLSRLKAVPLRIRGTGVTTAKCRIGQFQ